MKRIHPTAAWILLWLVLPNLPFVALWVYGGPPRFAAITLYYGLGIVASKLPKVVLMLAYLALVALDVAFLTSNTFNLSIRSLVESLEYIDDLDPLGSIEYTVLVGALLFSTGAALMLIARGIGLGENFSFKATTATMLAFGVADVALQYSPNYSFGNVMRVNAEFDSAIRRSGAVALLEREPGADRDFLLVMVEGLGAFREPEREARVLEPLLSDELLDAYAITTGTTPFFGSTTNAEIRELCGRWGDYADYKVGPHPECLPNVLRERGYETISYHGFTRNMFERSSWYGNLGFERSLFAEDLISASDRICKGVFHGLCDTDLTPEVIDELKGGDGPRFVYWLTLNSHLPIHPSMPENHHDCGAPEPAFGSRRVCRIANLWSDVLAAIESELRAYEDRPLPVVLIVGDHLPPFWTRKERSYFSSGKVPWVLLAPAEVGGGRTAAVQDGESSVRAGRSGRDGADD